MRFAWMRLVVPLALALTAGFFFEAPCAAGARQQAQARQTEGEHSSEDDTKNKKPVGEKGEGPVEDFALLESLQIEDPEIPAGEVYFTVLLSRVSRVPVPLRLSLRALQSDGSLGYGFEADIVVEQEQLGQTFRVSARDPANPGMFLPRGPYLLEVSQAEGRIRRSGIAQIAPEFPGAVPIYTPISAAQWNYQYSSLYSSPRPPGVLGADPGTVGMMGATEGTSQMTAPAGPGIPAGEEFYFTVFTKERYGANPRRPNSPRNFARVTIERRGRVVSLQSIRLRDGQKVHTGKLKLVDSNGRPLLPGSYILTAVRRNPPPGDVPVSVPVTVTDAVPGGGGGATGR